jgi:hypothetical protein
METVAKKPNYVGGGVIAAVAFAFLRALSIHQPLPTTNASNAPLAETHLAYSYSLVGKQVIVHATGQIGPNEADDFGAWRKSLTPEQQASFKQGNVTFALDSEGGIISGALAMADLLKHNKADTIVPNGATCASACVMVWGAGAHKTASKTARIGVHSARTAIGSGVDSADGTVLMARKLAEESAPPNVVVALTTTSSNDMRWLKYDDAIAWGATILDKNGEPES